MTTSPALQTADEALSAAGVDPGTGLSLAVKAPPLYAELAKELELPLEI